MFQQKEDNKYFHFYIKEKWKNQKTRRNFFNRKSLPMGGLNK